MSKDEESPKNLFLRELQQKIQSELNKTGMNVTVQPPVVVNSLAEAEELMKAITEGGGKECGECPVCKLVVPAIEKAAKEADLNQVRHLNEIISPGIAWLRGSTHAIIRRGMPLEDYQPVLDWLNDPVRRETPQATAMIRVLKLLRKTRAAMVHLEEHYPEVFVGPKASEQSEESAE